MSYKKIEKCRICKSDKLNDAFSLSEQFLSPMFVDKNENNDLTNIKIPLTICLCNDCGLVQLRETTNPELLYTNYFYRSATNDTMRKDLMHVVNESVRVANVKENDVVVDIGANDGTMIGFFPNNFSRIGVEPAKNISWDNLDKSITIVNDFFNSKSLLNVLSGRKVKLFTSCAMFYDLDKPNVFVSDVKNLLADDGVFVIQLSYLVSMLENMNFYDICHEHLEYYSLFALENLMGRNGLTIFDAVTNGVNGGSALVFITHSRSAPEKSERYKQLIEKEKSMNLLDINTYIDFYAKMKNLSNTIHSYLINEQKLGKNVIGLGASTKGNILLQFFGITKDILPYISEINPEKIGKRTLGTDIELISDEQANNLKPSVKLVLPWYFKNEIVKRESNYLKNGGKLLFPMPYAHVVTSNGEALL